VTGLLIQACIPLAALIALGYALGRLNTIDLKSVATLAIYAITPLVAFGSAARLDFTPALILLPVCTFMIAALIGLAAYVMGAGLDKTQRSLLPAACGSGNTGYFGLPVAMALLGEDIAGIYFLANLGVVVFETSLGYYFIARGGLPPREAARRVLRLPVLYALAGGLAFAACGWPLPEAGVRLWELCRGAYVVVGMMIAGLALAQTRSFRLDARLTAVAFAGKFVLWPVAAVLFATFDPGLFDLHVHQSLIILSMVPIAANLPAYAAANNAPVAEAALLVLASTVMAILAMPVLVPMLL